MITKNIHVSECKEGDMLAADIYNEQGVILAVEGTLLNAYVIDKLKELNIQRLKVYQNLLEPEKDSGKNRIRKLIASNYNKSIGFVKQIVKDLAAGRNLDYKVVVDAAEHIFSNIGESNAVIECLNKIKNTDEYTYTHSVNTAFYAMLIAKWLGMSEDKIKLAIKSGFLHDIGKVKIPASILNKQGKLSEEELGLVRQHTVFGYELIKDMDDVEGEVKKAVLMHHERVDGSGYPFQAKGEAVNIYARIVAVADVYDAMTSDRAYKKRATPIEAFEMFDTIGLRIFDFNIMGTFVKNIVNCYTGSKAILDNGEVGEIVYFPPQAIASPVIKTKTGFIDMSIYKEAKIIAII